MLSEVIDPVLLLFYVRVSTSIHHGLKNTHFSFIARGHIFVLAIELIESVARIYRTLMIAFTSAFFHLLDYF
jgi:hypothetical protein